MPTPATAAPQLTPQEIESKTFSVTRRGFDENEVSALLRAVAAQVRRLEQEVADYRLRNLEMGGRLKLAESLREDALARAAAAEAGRRHVEVLLAHLGTERSGAREQRLVEEVDALRAPAGEANPTADQPQQGAPIEEAAAAGPGDFDSDTYTQTEEQIRALEEAAAATVETTKAQVQRIARSALQLAQLWGVVSGDLGQEGLSQTRPAPTAARPVEPTAARPAEPPPTPAGEPATGREEEAHPMVDLRPETTGSSEGTHEAGSVAARPVKFTTTQARAAAAALHASARDDLHLAGFWIHEAEQEVSEDATLTSRTILDEANQLLTMAAELGHPAPELVEQYIELRIRARRLQE
jgi:DivIVA domain-containing protein